MGHLVAPDKRAGLILVARVMSEEFKQRFALAQLQAIRRKR